MLWRGFRFGSPRSDRASTEDLMMRAIGIIVLLGALAVGGWWVAVKRPADLRAEREAAEAALAAELNGAREAMFGKEVVESDVQWRETGLGYRILNEGTGAKPFPGARVRMQYLGRLKDGTVFDQSKEPVEFRIGGMIPGMSAAAQMLGTGGKGVFYIPPKLGYGGQRVAGIPPNSGLIFEIEMVAVNP